MKRWLPIVLTVILMAGLVYVYLHRQEFGLTGPSSSTGDDASNNPGMGFRPPNITWERVDRAPDGFKAEMPTDVREIQVPAYNEHGGSEQVQMIFSNPSSETTFSIAWADNPPVARVNRLSPDQTLDMARDNALARTQTMLTNESRASQLGFPARDFQAHNTGGGVLNSRLIYAGSRLYMLTAVFPSPSARRERDVNRFFDSFSITLTASGDNSGKNN